MMDELSANITASTVVVGSDDAVEQLARARQRAVDRSVDTVVGEILDPVAGALAQVLEEHRGMADELISAYEQLGVIFEVTRNLPSVQNEDEVLHLLLQSLRRTFAGCKIFWAERGAQESWAFHQDEVPPWDWMISMLDAADRKQGVVVNDIDPDEADGHAELMLAPIRAGHHSFGSLVLVRAASSPAFRASDMMIVESLANFCGDLIRNHRLVHEMREMSIQMVRSLVNAVDQKDEYTSGHSLRVAHYATMLGNALNLRDVDVQMIQWSALLHDIGKIGIRDNVLKKTGRLTDEEFAHIKEHPIRSHKVVKAVPQLADALDGILFHHEHYDGSGYPMGLRGRDIPLQARVIQIADVFDALTTDRSYRGAYHWSKALQIMNEEAGRTVDPNLQAIFDRMMRTRLDTDPEAWDRMIREANRFVQMLEGRRPDDEGDGS